MKINFIDVIVPTFNSGKFIEKCLDSLVNQKYESDYQIIVVDNGSKDNTLELVSEYVNKYENIVLLHQSVRSSYAARNTGIEFSTARNCLFIDSDCISSDTLLSTYERYVLGSNLYKYAVSGDIEMLKSNYKLFGAFDTLTYLNQELSSKVGIAATANLLVSRNVFDEIGLFDANLISGGDVEFTRRLGQTSIELYFLKEAKVFHPIRLTFRDNAIKSFRVGVGNGQIHKKNRQVYKTLKPGIILNMINQLKRNNKIDAFDKKISFIDKTNLFFASIIMQIINYIGRIRGLFMRNRMKKV